MNKFMWKWDLSGKMRFIIYVSKPIQYKSKCTKSITITNAMFENSQLQRLKSYANRIKPVSPSASFSNFAPTKRRSSTPPAFNSYITCKTFQLEKVQKRNEKWRSNFTWRCSQFQTETRSESSAVTIHGCVGCNWILTTLSVEGRNAFNLSISFYFCS
jgi:hypothetical protein